MMNRILQRARDTQRYLVEKSNYISAYCSTLYYFEIIYIMVIMLFVYGKIVSVVTGLTLTVLYTAHLVRLYFRKTLNRLLHLLIMEVHLAYTSAFLFNIMINSRHPEPYLASFIAARVLILVVEIPLIFLLTSEKAITAYD